MTERRPSASLRLKWTLAILAVALIPLAALAFTVVSVLRSALASSERELELAVVDGASREIAHALGDVEIAVHHAAEALSNAAIEDGARLTLAQDAIAAADAVDWVAVFDKDGAALGAVEKPGGGKPISKLDASLTVEPHPHWVVDRAVVGVSAARFVEPLVVDGVVTGWLVAGLAPKVFQSHLLELGVARLGRPDRLFVIDDELRVVVGDPTVWPPGSRATSTDLFERVQLGAGAFSRRIEAHTAFRAKDGTPMLGTVRVLPDQQWAVAVERPEAEAFAPLGVAQKAFWAAAAVIAVLALLAGGALARRTMRPIERLVALTRAYARREFGAKSDVKSNDELGQLGDALTRMAGDLASGEREIQRRAAVETALARYLPEEVATAVASGDKSVPLQGRRQEISVVFADVASFTSFVEKSPPERVVALLNELFTVLSEIVFRHGGMVDKFMGDCIMAVFGVREADDDREANHAERALAAAEDMQRFAEASAPRWLETYGIEVQLGIGVASGEALVGNLGSERRMEFTAIGDAVNVASRLESLARPGQTLVMSTTADRGGDHFELRSLGEHPVRGKAEPIEIFELQP